VSLRAPRLKSPTIQGKCPNNLNHKFFPTKNNLPKIKNQKKLAQIGDLWCPATIETNWDIFKKMLGRIGDCVLRAPFAFIDTFFPFTSFRARSSSLSLDPLSPTRGYFGLLTITRRASIISLEFYTKDEERVRASASIEMFNEWCTCAGGARA
jgi:hypothetical protein